MRPCLFGGPFTEPRRHDSRSLTRCCTRFVIIHSGNANESGITALRLSAHRHRRTDGAHTKLSIFRYRHEEKERDTQTPTLTYHPKTNSAPEPVRRPSGGTDRRSTHGSQGVYALATRTSQALKAFRACNSFGA